MNWLDKIKQEYILSGDLEWNEDLERLERVIREMSMALKNMPHDHSSKPPRDCYVCGLLKELPPDAKELLE